MNFQMENFQSFFAQVSTVLVVCSGQHYSLNLLPRTGDVSFAVPVKVLKRNSLASSGLQCVCFRRVLLFM